jgi:hypothetical protein
MDKEKAISKVITWWRWEIMTIDKAESGWSTTLKISHTEY